MQMTVWLENITMYTDPGFYVIFKKLLSGLSIILKDPHSQTYGDGKPEMMRVLIYVFENVQNDSVCLEALRVLAAMQLR